MRTLDWVVLCAWLAFIICYGLIRGRGSNTVNKYLLAGKTMPWYAVGLSIMATQASAITFISTTGQAYVDGMRFVQFYFGLPIAMVILSATAVPIYHRANVYTAYEYLEQRFDSPTRSLVSAIFLLERGLSVGVALAAPGIILSLILGWPDRLITVVMGSLVILFTTMGGIKAIQWADVLQMVIIMASLFVAFAVAIHLLPGGVSFLDAVSLAGVAGKLKAVDLHFDPNNRYNLWSGLIGGTFLFLSYFGTDQSQVQRYLTGKSIAQSRLSLLFNAIAKVPMQFFILFIGAMVFVFCIFVKPPVIFQQVDLEKIQTRQEYAPISEQYDRAFESRREAARRLVEARHRNDRAAWARDAADFRAAEKQLDAARGGGIRLVREANGGREFSDTNSIFLYFVTHHLPVGLVGLVIAVIFSAAMSSISGEINSLATVSVIDIYQRHVHRQADDRHYLVASRLATAFWGCYAVVFAGYARNFGTLIEVVNIVGSLFYGGMLGVFVLAFFFPRVRGRAAFAGTLVGEALILALFFFTKIAYLWYNLFGCLAVVGAALIFSIFETNRPGTAYN
jgi:SSS family transporter